MREFEPDGGSESSVCWREARGSGRGVMRVGRNGGEGKGEGRE